MFYRIVISLFVLLGFASAAHAQSCTGNPLALQILGSGGPGLSKDRASTGYLLWSGNRAKILIDAGGGTFARFGQAEAKFTDLSMVLVSHVHPDHVSDLPALLWSSRNDRNDVLPIAGPTGNDMYPALPVFLSRLFDEKTGAFQALGQIRAAPGTNNGVVKLQAATIDVTRQDATNVFDRDGFKVTALGIPHGPVPNTAYRIESQGKSVVISTDQNVSNPRFPAFARNADLLVMHLAIGVGAPNPNQASPAVVGRVAQEAGAKHLVLGHIGNFDLDKAIAEVKVAYMGPLTVEIGRAHV